jgi:hypothetical protein
MTITDPNSSVAALQQDGVQLITASAESVEAARTTRTSGPSNDPSGAGRAVALAEPDLGETTRPNVGEAFGIPTNVTELNGPDNDVPGFVSDDGCRLYFHREDNGLGRMYLATKTR